MWRRFWSFWRWDSSNTHWTWSCGWCSESCVKPHDDAEVCNSLSRNLADEQLILKFMEKCGECAWPWSWWDLSFFTRLYMENPRVLKIVPLLKDRTSRWFHSLMGNQSVPLGCSSFIVLIVSEKNQLAGSGLEILRTPTLGTSTRTSDSALIWYCTVYVTPGNFFRPFWLFREMSQILESSH